MTANLSSVSVVILSNDVVPGLGVPVAAPGLRSSGIAVGLRSHGIETELVVPADVTRLAGVANPTLPEGTSIVEVPDLMDHVDATGANTVVFTNANLSPHLQPRGGVRFVYDLFAPKMLERLASPTPELDWDALSDQKERALALADLVWVNGRRKMGYALGWMLRPGTEAHRRAMGKPSMFEADPAERIQLVEMPVLAIEALDHDSAVASGPKGVARIGIGGYAQHWSVLPEVHPAHSVLSSTGHELHALLPQHWSAGSSPAPHSALPESTVIASGPLSIEGFHRWVTSMDVMIDVFPPSAERRLAMITRSAVALGWGVPVIHGVDSEVADIIREFDAGWVETSTDPSRWEQVAQEVADAEILARKARGARAAQDARFDPHVALAEAASQLRGDQL